MNSIQQSTDATPCLDRRSLLDPIDDQPRSWSVASWGSFVAIIVATTASSAAAIVEGIHLGAIVGTFVVVDRTGPTTTARKLVTKVDITISIELKVIHIMDFADIELKVRLVVTFVGIGFCHHQRFYQTYLFI